MNISTGGPHILLFERDQQFTALLISEFQLAGYECHTARTAVEVFDAIARYPIRLVLVDLAQAAAARREFWVALDTQRRGRGVQVLTFQCFNLAGYGAQDPDDRSHPILADMQIDGMIGLLNLVETVRNRIPGSGSTSTQPRIPRQTSPTSSMRGTVNTPQAGGNSAYQGGTSSDRGSGQAAARASQANLQQQAVPPMASTATHTTMPAPLTPTPAADANNINQQSYTDKIRAVLYPNQRATSIQSSGQILQESANPAYDPQVGQVVNRATPVDPPITTSSSSMLQQLANGQMSTEAQPESSLDQLSRMLRERPSPTTSGYNNEGASRYTPLRSTQEAPFPTPAPGRAPQNANNEQEHTGLMQNQVPTTPRPTQEDEMISVQTLRASPIEDLPFEQHARQSNGHGSNGDVYTPNTYNNGQTQVPQAPATPLASITMPMPPTTQSQQVDAATRMRPTVPPPIITRVQEDIVKVNDVEEGNIPTKPLLTEEEVEEVKDDNPALFEKLRTETQEEFQQRMAAAREPAKGTMPNNAMLLDIVQSLPPMPITPPSLAQQQALQGRATRTLGSVLLEGHLVQQSRLEVAQNIQRMLRGVDMNYQLGEILLMFKLLTHDQLLAASLVSYGLITTQQIIALGRIRQELHSIGLEYDLENLLILFRMLTPEQLREVRSSWQG